MNYLDENNDQNQDCGQEENAPEQYNVESIVDKKKFGNEWKYLIKWEGYSHDANTWEPRENLEGVIELIEEFEEKLKKQQMKGPNNSNPNNVRNGPPK